MSQNDSWPRGLTFTLFLCLAGCAVVDNSTGSEATDNGDVGAFEDGEDAAGTLPDAGADTPDALSDVSGSGEVGDLCLEDWDCLSELCVDIAAGNDASLCSQFCADDDHCPEDFDCVLVSNSGVDAIEVCLPDTLCIDEDGDGYGIGPDCAGPDCDDNNIAVNPAARELCDTIDNDCDGSPDDDPVEENADCQTGFSGPCGVGRQVCNGGLIECVPRLPATDEICDGIDNDCDAIADEGADGGPLVRACYDGPESTEGVGQCGGGLQHCTDGAFTSCIGQVLPGTEQCNDLDDDCDGSIDNGAESGTYWPDLDGDGFGDADAEGFTGCVAPDRYVNNRLDCDDTRLAVHPDAEETAGDEIDQNCDGTETCYVDNDGDGHRADDTTIESLDDLLCDGVLEALATTPADDCDDGDPTVHPGAIEIPGDEIDQTCDGRELCYHDRDGDGFRTAETSVSLDLSCADSLEASAAVPAGDCADLDASRNPMAPEACNGLDDNCDGETDNGAAFNLYWPDLDGDGFGDASAGPVSGCAAPARHVDNALDCNDGLRSVNPDAAEIAGDEADQNCDGVETCFVDNDGDGHRADDATIESIADLRCDGLVEALASDPVDDCDDGDPTVHPGVAEVPGDEIDQTCDGRELCFQDRDGDGFRTAETLLSSDLRCDGPLEAAAIVPEGDCADLDASRNPLALEACNGLDDDCDGLGDALDPDVPDADRDGANRCVDCNDAAPLVFPGATETAGDGVDQNCDAIELCFLDGDLDGFRGSAAPVPSSDLTCSETGLASRLVPAGDCNDDLRAVNPDAAEIAGDGFDQNCDGAELCFLDGDNDGYRPDDSSTVLSVVDVACDGLREAPLGAPTGDCDDSSATTYPGAEEVPGDEVDQSCDGRELCFADRDADGYRTDELLLSADVLCTGDREAPAIAPFGDCADLDAQVNPGMAEICNGADDDCDTLVDSFDPDIPDGDGDGVDLCEDCDDTDPTITDSYTVHGPGGDIPDGSPFGYTSVIRHTEVSFDGPVGDLNVMIDINHEDPYFLRVWLRSPSGTEITLVDRPPCCGDDYLGTWFDETGSDGPIEEGTAPYTGTFVPEGSLLAFAGEDPNGTWEIEVADTIGGNVGTLNEWRLEFALDCE